jgi:hypothetical protein
VLDQQLKALASLLPSPSPPPTNQPTNISMSSDIDELTRQIWQGIAHLRDGRDSAQEMVALIGSVVLTVCQAGSPTPSSALAASSSSSSTSQPSSSNIERLVPAVIGAAALGYLPVKKLAYHFLSFYARHYPSHAIMTINTLLKDVNDNNPMVRLDWCNPCKPALLVDWLIG